MQCDLANHRFLVSILHAVCHCVSVWWYLIGRVFQEHQGLFRNPSRVYSRIARRARYTPYPSPPCRVSWTHKFFCLASVQTLSVPTSKGIKEALSNLGLGEKIISLPSNSNAADLHKVILDTFPPLASCGGYTVLKCAGKNKTLEIIDPPVGGHTPLSLSAVVGQSRVYLRPLQKDILPPAVTSADGETQVHAACIIS